MHDLSQNPASLRTNTAVGLVLCHRETLAQVTRDGALENLMTSAKAAGLLGAKRAAEFLPHHHAIILDGLTLTAEVFDATTHREELPAAPSERAGIVLRATATAIAKDGVEIEALTAVAVAALELCVLLRQKSGAPEIAALRSLPEKRRKAAPGRPTCAVLVCSDSTARGERVDVSGVLAKELLEAAGAEVVASEVVADDRSAIQAQLRAWVAADVQYVFTTGGTGLGPRDVTVEAVGGVIEREVSGIAEAMRVHGQMRAPAAMMSRAIAGTLKKTLIVTLPGSPKGVREGLAALLPAVFHARAMLEGQGH